MTELRGALIDFDGFSGYLSRPTAEPRGGVVLVHEIWGLVDHIKDVADRLAAEGYLTVAPDILSHGGVTPEVGRELERLRESADQEERNRMQPLMREAMTVANQPEYGPWAVAALRQVVDWLLVQPGVDGRVAATGFCFGGSYTFALAAADGRLRAAAPFYGSPPETARFSGFTYPIRAFYGSLDPRLMEGLPAVKASMVDAGVDFEAWVYEGARHAFFNDTNSGTYNPEAAADAWQRLLGFFAQAL